MFGLDSIAKTVTGIAQSATGNVKDFRKVLSGNPGSLGLLLPPQVSLGIKAANALGLKVPSTDVLTKQVMSELDKAVFGVYRPDTNDLIRALKGEKQSATQGLDRLLKGLGVEKIDKSIDSASKVLNSIDWLL